MVHKNRKNWIDKKIMFEWMDEWMNEWSLFSLKLYNFYKWETDMFDLLECLKITLNIIKHAYHGLSSNILMVKACYRRAQTLKNTNIQIFKNI
jgi:hypothetical protein